MHSEAKTTATKKSINLAFAKIMTQIDTIEREFCEIEALYLCAAAAETTAAATAYPDGFGQFQLRLLCSFRVRVCFNVSCSLSCMLSLNLDIVCMAFDAMYRHSKCRIFLTESGSMKQ